MGPGRSGPPQTSVARQPAFGPFGVPAACPVLPFRHGRGLWRSSDRSGPRFGESLSRGRLPRQRFCSPRGCIGRRVRTVQIAGDCCPYRRGCQVCAYRGRLHSVPPFVGRGQLRKPVFRALNEPSDDVRRAGSL